MTANRITIGDRYELDELPGGRGGMGEVYFGHDLTLDRRVAVKFVRFRDGQYDPKLVERFRQEAQLTAKLEHPGVPAIYDVGVHDSRPYLVMQAIRGITVADLVAEQGPLPLGWAAAIAAQVCSVLSAAHRTELVHRDLKPANIMLEHDGWVKVLDFGLAIGVGTGPGRLPRLTSTGEATPGTTAYMAPEQLVGGECGPHTDLYALGCTMYEMLTGEPAFGGDSAFMVMSAQTSVVPPPVSQSRPDVPTELDVVVAALLHKDPADRPAGAEAVYQVLLPYIDGSEPLPGAVDPGSSGAPRLGYARAVSALHFRPQGLLATGESPVEPAQPATPRTGSDAASSADPASEQVSRVEMAESLYGKGKFDHAAILYQDIADRLSLGGDPQSELLFDSSVKAATCMAFSGQPNLALERLCELLEEQRPLRGADDEHVLELRRQIGLLQWTCGQQDAARAGLLDLHAHLARLRGPDHPQTRQVLDDLNGMGRR